MLFHPAKVPLEVASILFKVLWPYSGPKGEFGFQIPFCSCANLLLQHDKQNKIAIDGRTNIWDIHYKMNIFLVYNANFDQQFEV